MKKAPAVGQGRYPTVDATTCLSAHRKTSTNTGPLPADRAPCQPLPLGHITQPSQIQTQLRESRRSRLHGTHVGNGWCSSQQGRTVSTTPAPPVHHAAPRYVQNRPREVRNAYPNGRTGCTGEPTSCLPACVVRGPSTLTPCLNQGWVWFARLATRTACSGWLATSPCSPRSPYPSSPHPRPRGLGATLGRPK